MTGARECQPDIVERLRSHAGYVENGGCAEHSMTDEPWLLREAADRIEELTKALTEAVAVFESWNDDETEVELLPTLRRALAPSLDQCAGPSEVRENHDAP